MELRSAKHSFLLMLDANSTLVLCKQCDLSDIHVQDPPPSTYFGSEQRRNDFMLGCP